MPITRSQPGSKAPSEGGQESTSAMTPAEVEILSKRISEKEKILQEQAEALKCKQEELEKIRYGIGQAQDPLGTSLKNRLEQIEQSMSVLNAIPQQLDALNRRIASMQPRSGRDTPDSPPPQEENRGQQERSPIRLKDAIDSIPKFDGHKMSVFQFCKMCERALKLIPLYHEYHLVQLIINKLHGHAYSAIEGSEYSSVLALTRRLKEIFGPNKSTDQYRGELANVYMKPNENIFDYVERVKELYANIIDGKTLPSGDIDMYTKWEIECKARDSFINGLPPELLVRVKLEHCNTLEDTVVAAIQLSKTLEAENLRRRATTYKPMTHFRADIATNPSVNNPRVNTPPKFATEQPANISRSAPFIKPLIPGQPGPNDPDRVCYYCKAPGHIMKYCQKLAYRRSLTDESANNQSKLGNATSVPATGVHRDAMQTGRPSTNVMILQEEPNPPRSSPV